MGIAKTPENVLLVATVFSKEENLIEEYKNISIQKYGDIILESPLFNFDETKYYEKEMGEDLKLKIFGYKNLISPKDIAEIKVNTNSIEKDIQNKFLASNAQNKDQNISRIINIDPGYITLNKFVLATTKDAGHRIYIDNGIFGEATLSYEHKAWKEHSYTYANYKNKTYQEFLTQLRDCYKELRK